MVTGGRCHGPNCTRDATDGPWCDPSCRDAWHAQFHWLYGDGRVQEPVIVRELVEPDGVGEDELPALDAALAATQRQIIESIDFGPAPQPAPVTVAEVARIAASLPRDRPGETVKLTEEQFAALRQALPDRPGWALNTQVNAFDGVTVEIVETVEESTPYLMAQRPRRVALHPDAVPGQVFLEDRSGWVTVGSMVGNPFEFTGDERDNPTLPAFSLDELPPISMDIQLTPEGTRDFLELFYGYPDDSGKGSTKQQVASKDPQVGRLAKWIKWLFGRTG